MIKDLLFTIALVSMFSVSAQSIDDPANLQEWTIQADKSISDKMKYPRLEKDIARTGTNSYKVTIDRQGGVIKYTNIASAKRASFNKASDSALKYVKFPSLPASYTPNQLTFTLNMFYYGSEEDEKKLSAKGIITVSEVE